MSRTSSIATIDLEELAFKHVSNIIKEAIEYKPTDKALIIYDTEYGLTNILASAYKRALPDAKLLDFNKNSKEIIISELNKLPEGSLTVLIQSTNFLLNEFRIRLHLFEKKLKVIEHLHLVRNSEEVWDVYINSLEYDKSYLRTLGPNLKSKLENTQTLEIVSSDATLTITEGLEPPKLNIGDYEGMANIGGTFPIGEVFTEARDFSKINGDLYIYAFASSDFKVKMYKPFKITINNGLVTSYSPETPEEFKDIMKLVQMYERPLIREIGFGLNKAITKERYIEDITAFERILGLHISLGEKHSVYKKPGITTHKTKFHIDLFPVVDKVKSDGLVIFENNKYLI